MTNTDLEALHATVVTPPEAPHGVQVEGPDGQTWFLSQFELGGARALVNTGQAEPYHVAAVRAWDDQYADSDAPNNLGLPVIDDEVRLTDGTTARVLQRYDTTLSRIMTGKDDAWQVTGRTGARVISLADIAGYVADEAPEIPEVDHAAALVLNAALDWERACERGFVTEHMAAADELHKAIRAWAPLVAG